MTHRRIFVLGNCQRFLRESPIAEQTFQPKDLAVLQELVLVTGAGLGNRIRAIAAARRLCSLCGARCTVVWKWGKFEDYFLPEPDLTVITALSDEMKAGYTEIRHPQCYEGGTYDDRLVSLTAHARVIVHAAHVFGAVGEPRRVTERDVQPWLLQPSRFIAAKVAAFQREFLPNAIGVHIRRTDNEQAHLLSPDAAYIHEIEAALKKGMNIFLASDNEQTRTQFMTRFPGRIVTYPKADAARDRWPRDAFDATAVEEDLIDFFLLASCKYVIGSCASSYSRLAMLYNGSRRCRAIGTPPLSKRAVLKLRRTLQRLLPKRFSKERVKQPLTKTKEPRNEVEPRITNTKI